MSGSYQIGPGGSPLAVVPLEAGVRHQDRSLDQRLAMIPQHQWASKRTDFNFHVEFRPGAGNVVVDALSRRDTETTAELAAISAPSFTVLEDLRH
jgi:hypothetical protein